MNAVAARIAAALLGAMLAGCVSPGRKYDAGAVTHRMATPDGKSFYKYFSKEQLGTLDIIKPGDSVSVRINAIYICDFAESNAFPENFTLWAQDAILRADPDEHYPPPSCSGLGLEKSKHYTRGEIVVLADVIEQGGGRTIAYSKNGFDAKQARVVYYDDDIRESGQFFSIANVPVYGPIKYSGNALFLRLFMLELDDEENAQTSAMLKKLAELGGRAYPPASPILKTLSSVGDALLSGEQDDLEFRYTMTFDPYPSTSASYLPLAVGNYVVVKSTNRSVDFEWAKQAYDNGTGGFVPGENSAHRRVSFISFKISKNEPALQQDGLQLYSEFEATLPAAGADYGKLSAATDALQKDYKAASALDRGRAAAHVLNTADAAKVPYAQAQASLAEILCGAADIQGDDKPNNGLGQADVDYLLRLLGTQCLDPLTHGTFAAWKALCKSATPPTKVCK
jgi:hypothetical protein